MEKVLLDYTICQANPAYHGGAEYADAVHAALLAAGCGSNLGIFFWRNRRVSKKMMEMFASCGVKLHPIIDIRNIPAILRTFGYTAIFSAFAQATDWRKICFAKDLRCLFVIHGLRAVELVGDGYVAGVDINEMVSIEKENHYNKVFENNHEKTFITVSEHSKASILKYYPHISPEKIKIFYSPLKTYKMTGNETIITNVLAKYSVKENSYGLLVSAGVWYKNALRGIKAFDKLFTEKHPQIPDDYKVLVLGADEISSLEAEIINKERFIFSGYVLPDELEIFYANAHLLLYPSLNEGFGYPPLEAMKYGTVCACSNVTSIPEVCRDMVLYFDPLDTQEISDKVLQCFDKSVRETLINNIKKTLPLVFNQQQQDLNELVNLIMRKEADNANNEAY
ncbi:MAG: glycosyltransferase [Lachnospiraceae bacterium]|nr:glycosyltransferase [Lachnospiraceae bacterium]